MKASMPTMNLNLALGKLFPEFGLPEKVANRTINGLTTDSRQVEPGNLFIALSGARVDGQQFIASACAKGASVIAVEASATRLAGSIDWIGEVPLLAVDKLSTRLSQLADDFFGSPSHHMNVIGVTGTNGKSTCVSLVAQLHNLTGCSAGTIGTLGAFLGDDPVFEFGMTTPDAVLCQKLLAQFRIAGAAAVAMEVSSHGLDQGRVSAVQFQSAIFTNISHDHLDYHGTLKHYAAAKQKLFEMDGLQTAIINLDDPHAQQMVNAARPRAKVLTYSLLHFAADIFATDIQYSTHGVEFRLVTPWSEAWVLSPLLGEFNVYNLIAAFASVVSAGVDFQTALGAIPKLLAVPGRMQKITVPADVIAVVDYAHTPDALAHAIAATRVHTSGCLWVVFGCGGDRDRTKRPAMAKIAERFADVIVVTSDNPRSENPESILAEICLGFRDKEPTKIVGREQAIHFAIANAAPGDVILIAGKGHENYQIIGEQSLPFDDVLVATSALQSRQWKGTEVRRC
jgi:UDP-N-acetylmuramoyl-L-alanyl-D-glutamate--2,6-diaminopimelate ligase